MRPRFTLEVRVPAPVVLAEMRAQLDTEGCPVEGVGAGRHMELFVHPDQRHFWSPWLSLDVDPADEASARISARFGPHPSVWTGFMSAYAFVAFVVLGGLVFGGTQALVRHSPWGLWAVPVGLAVGLGLYGASLMGQRLGADQMGLLRGFLDRCVGDPL
jgi:hypothetical protein